MTPPPHVMVVAYDFPPHAAVGTQRTLRLVRHLAASGWRVTVITAHSDYYLHGTPTDYQLIARVPESVEVVRTPVLRGVARVVSMLQRGRPAAPPSSSFDASPTRARTNAPSRASSSARAARARRWLVRHLDGVTSIPDSEVGWYLPAVQHGRAVAREARPDIVFASAPPWTGHLVGARLARGLDVPFVADFRDPWAGAPWRSARQTAVERHASRWLERYVVRAASGLVFTTHAVRDSMTLQYGESLPALRRVVPNGCDIGIFTGAPARPAEGGPFVLLHAGSLYGGRNPSLLLRSLATLIADGRLDRRHIRIRLLGAVSLPGVEIGALLDALSLTDIVDLPGRVSQAESIHEMQAASGLLLLQQGTAMSVPAKAYEYLAAQRPILALTPEGETAQLIRDSGMGLVAPPDDQRSIEDALLTVVSNPARFSSPCPISLYDGEARASEVAEVLITAIQTTKRPVPGALARASRS